MHVSVLMVRALLREVERAGGSRETFLRAAAIDGALLEDSSARLPAAHYARVIEAALEASGNPALGLRLVEQAPSFAFDVVGLLSEQAASMRAGIAAIARYSRLLAEGHEPELIEHGSLASLRFAALRGDHPAVRLTAELVMTGLAQMLRSFVGQTAAPSEVALAFARPVYAQEYERLFGREVLCFSAPHTQMSFPRQWLDATRPYPNHELYALLASQAERSLGRLERDAALAARIEHVLDAHAPAAPTMEQVARELGLSARSLRRRMQREGVRFGELRVRARVRCAKRMLERPGASIQETAHALGFASDSAFFRAFKRWTGMTPKQYQSGF